MISILVVFLIFAKSVILASFTTLHESDDSIILEAKKAAIESYGYINLSRAVNHLAESEYQVHVFKGSTGHSLFGGAYEHSLGTISMCRQKSRVLIAFHGSENLDDWISDLLATKQEAPNNLRGMVHRGFYDVVQSGYENILNILRTIDNFHEIEFIFTGHSLGGATATLAAAQFYSNFSSTFLSSTLRKNQIKIITFSAPCVGDEIFASYIEQIFSSNIARFTSNLDIVPNIPPWGVQAGDEIRILFLEQSIDKFSQAKEKFKQPGLQPKWQVVKNEAAPFGAFVFQVGKACLKRDLNSFSKAAASGVGIVLTVSHKIPDSETMQSAFFHYKLRNSIVIEGTETQDDSQVLKPGQVGIFDSVRNPLVRAFLSFFGGYSY